MKLTPAHAIMLAAALAVAAPLPALAQSRMSIGIQQEPTSLDPTTDATAAINVMLTQNLYEGLTSVDQAGAVIPQLAESWTISDDSLTYVFTLVEGVTFHDGTPFTAADVVFSFDRARAEDSTNPRRATFNPIESITAIDDFTVEIVLKNPDAFFLFDLAQGPASIISEASVETNGTRPVGTGAFRFEGWTRGDRLRLARNPDHRNADNVAVDLIEFRFISEPAAATAALLAGELDAFPGFPAPELVAQFEADPRFNVMVSSTEGEVILAMNNSRAPFTDISFRRAVSHAIDRDDIIDGAMYGFGIPIGSFYPPHGPAHVDLTDRYPLDHDMARELIAESGFDGRPLVMRLPPFPYATRSGEIIQSQLAAVGLTVQIENVEWGFWLDEVFRNKNYDFTIIAHTSPNDLGNFARGPGYFYGYEDEAFVDLWNAIRTETDDDARLEMLRQAQIHIAEQAVHGFLFQLPAIGIFREGVEGFWPSQPVLQLPLTEVSIN
ncbi:MAG: ABC transporter substrate-binding protein [Rhodobacteraceae bacterium]|nr:ABC transporter substrate-binding protein [Paracoccaceae bacterium]